MVDDHTGVFSQVKLNDGNRVLISFTQKEVAVFKLAFFGTVPTTKIWSLPTKECLAFVSKSYGTAKPLGVITNKVAGCYFLSELPSFLNKFFLINNNEDKKEGYAIKNKGSKKSESNTLSMEDSLFLHTIDHSNGSVKTLFEILKEYKIGTNDSSVQEKVAFEFFFLFLYLLESTLQTKLGQIKGRELADKVLEVALESLSKNSDFEKETFKASLLDDYMERMKTYSQFSDFIAEKPAGTLFWEFGKTIAKIISNGQDIRIITLVQTSCTNFLININEIKLSN